MYFQRVNYLFNMKIPPNDPKQSIKNHVHKFFFLVIFTFSGACNSGDNLFSIKTIENRYRIAVARSMERQKDHSPVLARLYIDQKKGELITVTDNLKEGGIIQLDSYLKILQDKPELIGLTLEDPKFGKPIKKQINGLNALQTEVLATMKLNDKWQRVWGILVYLEGKTHIYQISAWLVNDDPGEDDTRLHQMINSFEEIRSEEY